MIRNVSKDVINYAIARKTAAKNFALKQGATQETADKLGNQAFEAAVTIKMARPTSQHKRRGKSSPRL